MEGPVAPVLPNIYKLSRQIKRHEQSLYNALRSIYEDAGFVEEIRALRPQLPLIANLRCGLWYSRSFDDVCYFKSTDGHTGNWSFSSTRLNMHVALMAATRGGCVIVDATRKGKRFPDSMSKTIPIWTCVINRAINTSVNIDTWDTSLHLPSWVSATEKSIIESRIPAWVEVLKTSGADLASLASVLKKPLQPLWISQRSLIWVNEVTEVSLLPFTPIILLSASQPLLHPLLINDVEFSWSYIPGAADDEESWARGLTPSLFWYHCFDIINAGPGKCNRKVAEFVEQDRVCHNLRGEAVQQPIIRAHKKSQIVNDMDVAEAPDLLFMDHVNKMNYNRGAELKVLNDNTCNQHTNRLPKKVSTLSWIGSSGMAVGNAYALLLSGQVDAVIDCTSTPLSPDQKDFILRLPIMDSKSKQSLLQTCLVEAIAFARQRLQQSQTILFCCDSGEDVSVCLCLAVLLRWFNRKGKFDDGVTGQLSTISKSDVRQRLVYVCSFVSNARPSRRNLKQVYNFLLHVDRRGKTIC